jgi:hypothetical protein
MSVQRFDHFGGAELLRTVGATETIEGDHNTFGMQVAAFVQAVCIAPRTVAVELFLPFHHVALAAVFLGWSRICRALIRYHLRPVG